VQQLVAGRDELIAERIRLEDQATLHMQAIARETRLKSGSR
jgi:hypothetical protein